MKAVLTSNLGAMVSRTDREAMRTIGDAYLKASEVTLRIVRQEVRAWTSRTSNRGTKALERSFQAVIKKATPEGVIGGVFSDSPYANIHNRGGIIRAKGRALTIPISREAEQKTAREFGKRLFVMKKPGRMPILAEAPKGLWGKIIPHYILKPAVRITPKNYLDRAAAKAQPLVQDIIRDAAMKTMRSRR